MRLLQAQSRVDSKRFTGIFRIFDLADVAGGRKGGAFLRRVPSSPRLISFSHGPYRRLPRPTALRGAPPLRQAQEPAARSRGLGLRPDVFHRCHARRSVWLFKEPFSPPGEEVGKRGKGPSLSIILYVAGFPHPAGVLAPAEDGAVALGLRQGPDLGVHHPAAPPLRNRSGAAALPVIRSMSRVPVRAIGQSIAQAGRTWRSFHDFSLTSTELYLSPRGRDSDFNILAEFYTRLSVRNRKRGDSFLHVSNPLSCVFQALARGQARSQMQENAFSPARGEIRPATDMPSAGRCTLYCSKRRGRLSLPAGIGSNWVRPSPCLTDERAKPMVNANGQNPDQRKVRTWARETR